MPRTASVTRVEEEPEVDARVPNATIEDVVASDARVSPDAPVAEVAERFFRAADLDAIALVSGDDRPLGVLTRARLLMKLARRFGQELYARMPAMRIADLAPLVLGAATPIPDAVDGALSRPVETLYDAVVVVDADGAFLGLVPVRDLVQRQRMADARRAAEHEAAVARARELEEVDGLRRRFIAHAAHELRSPVAAILLLGEVLRRAAAREDLAKVQERLPALLHAAEGLRATVDAMLDLSKLEAGQARVTPSRVDIVTLLEEVAQTARPLLRDKPVAVVVDANACERLEIETDRQKLRQIVLNLASNAAKFTAAGRVTLEARPAGAGCKIAVRDTGPGIAEQDLPLLFVPFGQLEGAATRPQEGTGLGLVIARSLATLLGGAVGVESRLGEGSTFTVTLPARGPRSARP